MSSSMINSPAIALATAMAAVSGTVILLSFCIQKTIPIPPSLRSCISSQTRKKKNNNNKNKNKRVHFAKDVVDPIGNGDDFRKQHEIAAASPPPLKAAGNRASMPANRVALYNGILRDRSVHRYTYS